MLFRRRDDDNGKITVDLSVSIGWVKITVRSVLSQHCGELKPLNLLERTMPEVRRYALLPQGRKTRKDVFVHEKVNFVPIETFESKNASPLLTGWASFQRA